MHTDISACGDAPCWVYANENVSAQLSSKIFVEAIFVEAIFVLILSNFRLDTRFLPATQKKLSKFTPMRASFVQNNNSP